MHLSGCAGRQGKGLIGVRSNHAGSAALHPPPCSTSLSFRCQTRTAVLSQSTTIHQHQLHTGHCTQGLPSVSVRSIQNRGCRCAAVLPGSNPDNSYGGLNNSSSSNDPVQINRSIGSSGASTGIPIGTGAEAGHRQQGLQGLGGRLGALTRLVLRPSSQDSALFMLIGTAMCVALTMWSTGTSLRKWKPYRFNVAFTEAPKVGTGTPLLMKGVDIGSVTGVDVQLDKVVLEVEFLLSQTGMVPASYVDINPTPPQTMSAYAKKQKQHLQASLQQQKLEESTSASPATTTTDTPTAAAVDAQAQLPQTDKHKYKDHAASSSLSASEAASAALPGVGKLDRDLKSGHERLAKPHDVKACRLQERIVCAGDMMIGEIGVTFDELTRRSLDSVRGSGFARPQ